MMIAGYYYLHSETKDLIFKKFEPESDSPFVAAVWTCDTSNRANAWILLAEAWALGAREDRIRELAGKWGIDDRDAFQWIERGAPFRLKQDGEEWFAAFVCDPESWGNPGRTALEAFKNLIEPGMQIVAAARKAQFAIR